MSRSRRRISPKARRAVHEPDCYDRSAREYQCGGAFTCKACGRVVGNCRGASDDFPNDCELCWARKTDAGAPSERDDVFGELKPIKGRNWAARQSW